MNQNDAGDNQGGGDKMDNDGFLVHFFAAEFGPDKSENDAHEESGDGDGGIAGGGSGGDARREDEGGVVSKVSKNTTSETREERAINFVMAGFDDLMIAAAELGAETHDGEVTKAFAEVEEGELGEEAELGGVAVFFDEENVGESGDEDVEEGKNDSADFGFARALARGENNEEWCGNNDGKSDELDGVESLAEQEPAED